MISAILTILMIIVAFKIAGFCFKIFGKLLGFILGIVGYVIVGAIAVTGLGLAIAFLPIIIIIGVVALIVLCASA